MFKFKDILAIILGAGIFSFGIYFLVIPMKEERQGLP